MGGAGVSPAAIALALALGLGYVRCSKVRNPLWVTPVLPYYIGVSLTHEVTPDLPKLRSPRKYGVSAKPEAEAELGSGSGSSVREWSCGRVMW